MSAIELTPIEVSKKAFAAETRQAECFCGALAAALKGDLVKQVAKVRSGQARPDNPNEESTSRFEFGGSRKVKSLARSARR